MRYPLSVLLFSLAPLAIAARAATPQEVEFFEKNVRPVLVESCYKCHGVEKQKAGLRVDSREAILKGSENGPVVQPGKPEESEFIKSLRHTGETKMPEKADKLPEAQITALAEWVRIGMPWPDGEGKKLTLAEEAARKHWSYQPVKRPALPAVKDAGKWVQTEIDRIVLAKLESQKLAPSPLASRRALIRRATFDLTGLPPTEAEIAAFENDTDPNAWAKAIDRLLASPRYGERWGRYWLDVARYSDTKGYLAGNEERRYPFSYTYRDWVISALNADLPYDRFLMYQIAADRLVTDADPAPLAAMGFLTLGRRFLNSQPDIIDDRIDVICRGTMGLTVTCARCHDHKFDPISQKDYYALYGVLASSEEPKELPPLLATARDPKSQAEYDAALAERQGKIDQALQQHATLVSLRAAATTGSFVPVPREAVAKMLDRAGRESMTKLRNKIDELNAGPLAPPHAMVMRDLPQPITPRVFIRGNPSRPGDIVPRRFLTVLSGGNPEPFKDGSGRLELAKAIANKENPLTSRVMVNRVWSLHIGAPLVRTPGDFGVKGELPTNPELLDYLASRFSETSGDGLGWSLKKLHRLIMLSATYQQASDDRADGRQIDADNRLLWRMNRRRLDFEATRDSLLFAAGQLDLTMGGRGVELTAQPAPKRRTIYGYIDRQNLPGVFRTFDFANPDTSSPARFVTTVPQQALFMLNSPFVVEQARALAGKMKPPGQPTEADVQSFYRQVFARKAEPAEVEAGIKFVTAQLAAPPEETPKPTWQYGYGSYDESSKRVNFTPLPHWAMRVWQGGPKLPDQKLGWLNLHAHGGHPDTRAAVIRRWTAPRDGFVAITGQLARPAKEGDGVRGRIVSSRDGQLLDAAAAPTATVEMKVARVAVKVGDTIDFIVEAGGGDTSDSFAWTPVLAGDIGTFDANLDFSGPPPPTSARLTAWEKYAQVLLASNEFVFVD